jgi:hypothetical protein
MDETEFSKLLDNLYQLKPEQLERVFQTIHEMFESRYYSFSNKLPTAALAWRIKQAWLLIKNRNVKKLPPRQ